MQKTSKEFLRTFAFAFLITVVSNITQAQNCTLNANIDQSICGGTALTLTGTASGFVTGSTTWSQVSGPSVVITLPNALVTTVTGITGGNVYRFRLSANCSDGSLVFDDVLITVRQTPVANAGLDRTFCPASPAGALAANAPAVGETGVWSGNANGITVVTPTSPTSNINVVGTSSGVANLTWTLTNTSSGCTSSDIVVITNLGGVSPVSAGPDILATAIACYGTTTSATMAGSQNGTNTGTWTAISGPNTPVITTPSSRTTTITNLIQGTYTFRWTVSGPCVNGYDEMQVFVPVATATLTTLSGSSTQTFCDNRTSVVLSATAPQFTGETVLWTYVSGPAGSVITSPTSPTTTITGLNGTGGSTYVYRYTITNTFGCTASVTRTISFIAPPASIIITGGNQVLGCNVTTASVPYTVNGGNQTQWRLLSGPAPGTYPSSWNNAASSPASITGLNNIGTYVVQLQRIVSGATNTCPPVTATVNVTTSKTPTAINAGTKQVLACNIYSTTLAGNTISTGTGTWSQVSGPNTANIVSVNSPTSAVNGLINGLYKFRWLSNGGPACPTNQGDASVEVSNVAPSTSVAGTPQTVCFNTPVQLAANTPVLNETGTWTVSPSTGVTISNINRPNAIVTLPNPATAYTFTWTIVNGCGTSSSNVLITTLSSQGPVASNAGTDQCQPAGTTSITLAGNNPSPGNGFWTKITGGAATITTPSSTGTTVTGMSNGIYTFEWAISTGGCAVSRDTMMVTISVPVTTAAAGADQQICTTSATFAANTPSVGTGSWSEVSAPAGYTITNPNSPTSTIIGLVEGVYTFRWTISNGSCTSSTDDIVLYVSTPPTIANAGTDQSLCGPTSTTLAGNTPTNGTGAWSLVSGPNVPVFTSASSPSPTATGLIQGTYILRWTITAGAYCPSSSDDVSITVVPLANAGANLTPCGVTTTSLSGNAGSTGTWTQVGSTPNIATITTTDPNTAIASGLITGVYTFRYSIAAAGSCPATTSDILCTVSGQGTDANAGPDQDVCRTAASITVTLAGNTPIVGTGTWTKLSGPTGGTTFSPNANTPNATVSLTNAGIYVYVWTVGNGSCTIADQVRINVFLPPTTANAGSNQTQVCGDKTTMAANAATNGTGGWTQVSGPNTATITSTIMPNTTITNLIAGTYVFRWTISNGPCATSSSTVSVTVYTPPTTANAGTDQTLCNVTNANLAGNTITTGTGLWSQVGSTPNIAGITTPSSPTTGITGLVPGVYTFSWTSTNTPCTTSDDVQITIYALPTTANAGSDQSICQFAPVVLAGNTPTTGIGTWSQISGPSTVTFSAPASPTSSVTGVVVGTYVFQWNISNGTCTTSTDQVQIVINNLPSLADAGPDQTGVATCGLTTVTLAANNPTIGTGKWSIVSGTLGAFSDENSRTSTFTGTAGTTYILRWTISYLTCTSYTDDVVIKFNGRPAITAMTTSVCSPTAFTVTPVNSTDGFVPAGTTYSWTAPSGTGFTGGTASSGSPTSISGTLMNTTNAPVTATYTVTPTSGLCTGSPFTVTVTVNPKPAVTAMTTSICSSGTFTTIPVNSTNGIVPSGTTYGWSAPTVTGGITGGISGSGASTINGTLINPTNIARTATYTVTPTSGSCTGSTFTVTVTVSPKPAVNNLSANICSGGTFTTTPVNSTNGIVPAGTTYSWSAPAGFGFTGGAASSGSPTSISGTLTNTTNAAVTAIYTVTPTSGSCTGSAFTVTVTVNPKPAINNLTATICSAGTFTTTPVNSTDGIVPTGTTYSWPAPAGFGFTGGAASSGSPTNISGTLTNTTNAAVTATYTVTPTSGSCAGSTFTVTVTVNPKTAVSGTLTSIATEGCNISALVAGTNTLAYLRAQGLTITDASGDGGLTVTSSDGTPIGTCPITIIRTYTITDVCLNATTATQTITVDDSTAPAITCNINTAQNVLTNILYGYQHAGTTWDATATDACGYNLTAALYGATTASGLATLNIVSFNLGTTTVTWTASDNCGNSTSCSFDVIVSLPVIDAVADAGISVNGYVGGTSVGNVLGNDLLGGSVVMLSQVNLSQVSSSNAGVSLDPMTGSVHVASGTPAGTYTLTYEICEKLNPGNCTSATVSVPVSAAVIDAVDGSGTVNGRTGGTTIADVLYNDLLNGVLVSHSQVNLSLVSSTSANVTLNTTTGAVNVAPGIPAGTYYVTYQICEKLNPTNCDQAVSTAIVTASPIQAGSDAGSSVNGYAGGISVSNVLGNDFLNGVGVLPGDVTLSFISSTNPNITLSGSSVVVAAGTPASTYTLVYQICETLNPSNCSQTTVTVPVSVAPLVAVGDAGSANGFTGGVAVANVLANDLLSGSAVNPIDVTLSFVSSTNAGISLNTTSGLVSVAAGTPAGTYTLTYQVCSVLNPGNCTTANVTVTVIAPAIDAVADAGSVIGMSGGVAVSNVLSNDLLGGALVDPFKVNLDFVSSMHPNITLSGTDVVVAAGTPAGTYTLTYEMCEKLNPANCDQTTVTVNVTAAALVVTADNGSVNGMAGGTAVSDVLTNDLLNGVPVVQSDIILTQISTTSSNVTLNITTGAVVVATVAPGTPAGTYTLVYQVCEKRNPTNCSTGTVNVTVTAAPILAVDDLGNEVNSISGGNAVSSVLNNDLLNGLAVVGSDVTISFISSTHANVTLNTTTGAVNVASGTPVGTYYVIYQICEVLNPTNCKQATVTVPVHVDALIAINDAGSSVNGFAGGTSLTNVLGNDQLSGVPVVPSSVSLSFISSTHAGVTLSGANVVVAVGTPAGTYSLVYQICDNINPLNCSQATVTVPVSEAVIAAVNEAGSANGYTGGTAVSNVLTNDLLNGSLVDPAKVGLSYVSSTSSGVTLSGSNVVVAAGTKAGTYILTYEICELLNASNCDQAEVTVTVTTPVIDAVADAGSANGMTGDVAVNNVLSNDLLGGSFFSPSKVALSFVSSTNSGVTLSGSNVVVAAGTPAGIYTLTYQVCEILNPGNCDQTTVTVTVSSATIVAVSDMGISVNGYTGGISVANVLSNDLLGGSVVMLSQVNLSQISSSNAGISLDPLTESVHVASGTPTGTYTLTYEICEKLNPGNCTQATVSVPVSAAVIDAVDGSGTVNGRTGGTTIADVLYNDLLNGVLVSHSQVNLSLVSSTNANVTLNTTTGAVNVAPGTPAGTYYVTYRICEILNSTNCDQAVSTAIVTASPIQAGSDAGSSVNGYTGGISVSNVLGNDVLNGVGVLLGDVNLSFISSTNPNITLSGSSVVVAAGTPASTYTLVYQICEKLNPSNCSQTTVTVPVSIAPLVAVGDAGSANGFTGGVAVDNVLANDLLSGATVNPTDVALSFVSSTNVGISLNTTSGSVNVAAGTPAGIYTLTYQICEILNPGKCTTANVVVTVLPSIMNPVTDSGTAPSTGGVAIPNVTSNDLINGIPATLGSSGNATINTSGSWPSGITLDTSTGAISVANGTAPGIYNIDYTLCDMLTPQTCVIITDNITVTAVITPVTENGTITVSGGTAITNVVSNDMVNGVAAVLGVTGNATVAPSGIWPAGITLDPTTGTILVAAGTIAGTYPVIYQLCDKLTPQTSCATITDYITINVIPIIAVPDVVIGINGKTGSVNAIYALLNDKLNGNPFVLSDINLNVTTQATALVPGGNVPALDTTTGNVSVPSNTPAGDYTITYTICEKLNPVNCSTTTVSINVLAIPAVTLVKTIIGTVPTIIGGILNYNLLVTNTGNVTLTNLVVTDANAIVSGSPISSLVPMSSGTITASHVLTQQDILSGTYSNTAVVIGKDPFNNDVTDISGTAVDNDNPTVAVLTISPPMSIDDNVITTQNTDVVINVLLNDDFGLNGPSTSTITASNGTHGTVTVLDGGTPYDPTDDKILYSPEPGFYGADSFTYTICNKIGLCSTATVVVTINPLYNLIQAFKSASIPVQNPDNSFSWKYTIMLQNKSNQLIDSIHVQDDLTKVFDVVHPTPTFEIISISATGDLIANGLYNGNNNVNLLLDRSYLNGAAQDSIVFEIKVQPNYYTGNVLNQAVFEGKDALGNKFKGALSDDKSFPGSVDPTTTTIPETLSIPDAFSPSGDGINDLFVIPHSSDLILKIEIYNRWGNRVYISNDYQNDWDGKGTGNFLGKDLPTGTYYYIIQTTNINTGKINKYANYLTLRRS